MSLHSKPLVIGSLTVLFMVLPLDADGQRRVPAQPEIREPTLQRIWEIGMEDSHVASLAQVLMDSVGPRLTGSPRQEAASDWAVKMYGSWGVEARNETYGTWRGWRRGITHVDLLEPRVRTLEATMLAWSPGTDGPVEAEVVTIPALRGPGDLREFLTRVEGRFVLVAFPEPTCRPDDNWEEWATPESLARMRGSRDQARELFESGLRSAGVGGGSSPERTLGPMLEAAGAAGILTSRWSEGWGVQKVFRAATDEVPTIDVACEDYGLLHRLASNGQGPRVRIEAEAEHLGDVPVANTIAVITGTELPNEYVLLSAHFDSWDAASGATDNGTGTVTMMEAIRILKEAYPAPRRTIMVGHWNGEEQGLNGSRAFAHDHPEIVQGLQVLLNQDNGTGRAARISMQGLVGPYAYFQRWLSNVPTEITQHITLGELGTPGGGGSDYASFVCAPAPAFSLSSLSWDYGTYTWHTNRDTYDKVSIDDVTMNATLTAMLAYQASEDPDRLPREQRVMPIASNGSQAAWPACRDGRRNADGYR